MIDQTMETRSLLKSQRTEIFLSIKEKGLETSEFDWIEILKNSHEPSGNKISKLLHKPSGFYFTFDNIYSKGRYDFVSEFSPGAGQIIQRINDGSFDSQFHTFKAWLVFLIREIETIDLWEEMSRENEVIESYVSKDDNSSFTDEEQKGISKNLDELKEYLLTAYQLTPEQVEPQIQYLKEASVRLGRKDWKSAFLGIILSLIILTSAAYTAFQFSTSLFFDVLNKTPSTVIAPNSPSKSIQISIETDDISELFDLKTDVSKGIVVEVRPVESNQTLEIVNEFGSAILTIVLGIPSSVIAAFIFEKLKHHKRNSKITINRIVVDFNEKEIERVIAEQINVES